MSCRLCLNSAEILIPVFDASGTDAMRMAATVAKFTGIQLSASDTHHSSKICVSCWASVDNFQKFCLLVAQRQAELSDLELTEEREETPQVFEMIETDDTHFEQEMEVDFAMMSAKNARNEDETLPEDIKDMLYCEAEPAQMIKIEEEEATKATTATKKRKVKRTPNETLTNPSKNSRDVVSNEASDHEDALGMYLKVEGQQQESDSEIFESRNSQKDSSACFQDDRLINCQMQLVCDVCTAPAPNFLDLLKHFKVVHKTTGYAVCCGKRLYSRSLLIDHINVHKNPEYLQMDANQNAPFVPQTLFANSEYNIDQFNIQEKCKSLEENQKMILASQKSIAQKLTQIQDANFRSHSKMLAILNQIIKKGTSFDQQIEFPMNTLEDIAEVNNNVIQHPNKYVAKIKLLISPGGLNANFNRLMSNDLILATNYDGVNDKTAFKKFQALNNALFEALKKDGYSENDFIKEVRNCYKNHKGKHYKKAFEMRKKSNQEKI